MVWAAVDFIHDDINVKPEVPSAVFLATSTTRFYVNEAKCMFMSAKSTLKTLSAISLDNEFV